MRLGYGNREYGNGESRAFFGAYRRRPGALHQSGAAVRRLGYGNREYANGESEAFSEAYRRRSGSFHQSGAAVRRPVTEIDGIARVRRCRGPASYRHGGRWQGGLNQEICWTPERFPNLTDRREEQGRNTREFLRWEVPRRREHQELFRRRLHWRRGEGRGASSSDCWNNREREACCNLGLQEPWQKVRGFNNNGDSFGNPSNKKESSHQATKQKSRLRDAGLRQNKQVQLMGSAFDTSQGVTNQNNNGLLDDCQLSNTGGDNFGGEVIRIESKIFTLSILSSSLQVCQSKGNFSQNISLCLDGATWLSNSILRLQTGASDSWDFTRFEDDRDLKLSFDSNDYGKFLLLVELRQMGRTTLIIPVGSDCEGLLRFSNALANQILKLKEQERLENHSPTDIWSLDGDPCISLAVTEGVFQASISRTLFLKDLQDLGHIDFPGEHSLYGQLDVSLATTSSNRASSSKALVDPSTSGSNHTTSSPDASDIVLNEDGTLCLKGENYWGGKKGDFGSIFKFVT